jgi:LAS superfamily LD-carboxypeptidase LdcB
MAVNITNEELDLFNKNGFTDDDVRATVENYRSQGLDDNAIRAKVQSRLDSWSMPQEEKKEIVKPIAQPVEQTSVQPIKKQPLTEEEKQAEIARIKADFEAKNKEIDREHAKQMAKLYGGALLEIGSAVIPVGAGLRLGGLALKAGKPIA